MSVTTLFSNVFITVEYHPEDALIYHVVHRPIKDDEMLKEALSKGSEALAQYGISKWLSDDRKNGPLSPHIIEWGRTEWHPSTIEAGWRYWANVVPTEVKAAGSLVPIMDSLHKLGLQMRVFTSPDKAFDWLRESE